MSAVEKLLKLEAEATPGPWEASTDDDGDVVIYASGEWLLNVGDWSLQNGPPKQVRFIQDCDVATGKLIAAMRPLVKPLAEYLAARDALNAHNNSGKPFGSYRDENEWDDEHTRLIEWAHERRDALDAAVEAAMKEI